MHMPFGTWLNLYDFIDTGNAMDAGYTANAFKIEYLIGNLEVALSAWSKKGHTPVWGADFSTRILGVDTLGEVSVAEHGQQPRMLVQDGQLIIDPYGGATYAPSASLDISKGFTVGEFKDRLTFNLEGYYNRTGYDNNILADSTVYAYAQPIIMNQSIMPLTITQGTPRDFIRQNNLYSANYFSRTYLAMFTTFNRFILTDMTLSINYIRNMVDASSQGSLGLNYIQLNGFKLGCLAIYNFGNSESEYAWSGEKCDLQMTFGIDF
jgi:hypothetical protein